MNRFLIASTLILLINCSDQRTEDNSGWTKPALEGQWKFVSATLVENTPFLNQYPDPQIFPDEAPLPQPPYIGPDLIFEKDTLYELKYPESLNYRIKFSLDSGYLFSRYMVRHNPNPRPIELRNDTLFIYNPHHGRSYIKEVYLKTAFNDSIVSILKTQGVNYPALSGTWMLERFGGGGGDGSEWELDFPFKIPDSLVLSREDLIQVTNNKMVYRMLTSGKKHDYLLSYNKFGYLKLTPGKWYQGDDPWIHFTRKEMDN